MITHRLKLNWIGSSHVLFWALNKQQNKTKHFKFEKNGRQILSNINLEIFKGETVGFIGSSGSGKSTLIDILIGLHQINEGSILVDGKSLVNNEIVWRKRIGYVPQSIFLVDDSLKRNIAFGLKDEEIDENLLLKALDAAQLTEYVNQLPNKLDTPVGERGVRISGGQRQRIAIARALYKDSDILILDESTNALDLRTEARIIKNLHSIKLNKIIIIISHRKETRRLCDYKINLS